ncbi:MAG TPA: hypothetical protein VFE47_29825 [Tepidisphaeraceae bacterium]|jgi:hypothetical protein|nr:hypothetical protein [Tepidisphaeraceae bacterium]
MRERPACDCFTRPNGQWQEHWLHTEPQDTTCDAWKRLLDLIERAADGGWEELEPAGEVGRDQWWQISTLPPSIAKLKAVKKLNLYGSSLVRIPPEIGEMASLEIFEPYTSYRLHWFPYEITRCTRLKSSCVSTRALYGNHKFRPPFPRLPQGLEISPGRCSVCNGRFPTPTSSQVWISAWVGTDVLPLLVHACCEQCIAGLPKSPEGYFEGPHRGGLQLEQPPADKMRALSARKMNPRGI